MFIGCERNWRILCSSVMLRYCCKSHFILLHLWMLFFNEAEYAAASNVHDCGIITFHNHDEYTHTHTHTPARYHVCDWHTYSHVQSQKASARLSFTHHFLSSFSLTHTHTQKLIPLITDLHNRQHNSTGGPPQALFPSPPTQPESEEWEKQKKKKTKKKRRPSC